MARYVVEKRLGAGGMAEVFRAKRLGAEGFTRRVALKRVLPHWSSDENFARMFIAEARLAAQLDHPNIVSVLDFDRDENGCLYLAMEYVEGCDAARLRTALASRGQSLSASAAAFICAEVLRALDHAHRAAADGKWLGIVHRDVSPHNVLIGRSGAVKLADFGIAKATAASTHSGMVRGKLAYMSPEQANGEALDGRSDVFAVGIMLYELLAGLRPFDGETDSQTLANILMARHTPLGQRAPWVPWDLQQVASRLLVQDREQRFASAQEALRALVACGCYPTDGPGELAALVEQASPPASSEAAEGYIGELGTSTRTQDPEAPKSRAWVAAAAAVLLLGGIAVLAPIALRQARNPPPSAAPSPAPAAVVAPPAPVAPPAVATPPDAGVSVVDAAPVTPSAAPAPARRAPKHDWEVPSRSKGSEVLVPR